MEVTPESIKQAKEDIKHYSDEVKIHYDYRVITDIHFKSFKEMFGYEIIMKNGKLIFLGERYKGEI